MVQVIQRTSSSLLCLHGLRFLWASSSFFALTPFGAFFFRPSKCNRSSHFALSWIWQSCDRRLAFLLLILLLPSFHISQPLLTFFCLFEALSNPHSACCIVCHCWQSNHQCFTTSTPWSVVHRAVFELQVLLPNIELSRSSISCTRSQSVRCLRKFDAQPVFHTFFTSWTEFPWDSFQVLQL